MTYQADKFAALISNYSEAMDLYEGALNSAGNATQKFGIYQESTAAKIDKFKASWESFWQDSLDSSILKGTLDATTKLLDTFGNLPTILGIIATGFGLWKGTAIIKWMTELNLATKLTTLSFNTLKVAISTNPIGFIATTILTAVAAFDIFNQVMESTADNYKELIDATQKEADNHKALASQYEQDIQKAKELIDTRNSLAESSENLADTDSKKIDANQSLINSEQELGKVIGQQALDKLKAANFSQDATNIVVSSLDERRKAEESAYKASSEAVKKQTDDLKRNIENQIKQVGLAVEAYGILGKLQETGLATEKGLAYARFKLNPTVENAQKYDEIVQRIKDFYNNQKSNKIEELANRLNSLGGVGSSSAGNGTEGGNNGTISGTKNSSSKDKSSTFNLYESTIDELNSQIELLNDRLSSDPSLAVQIQAKLNTKKELIEKEVKDVQSQLKTAFAKLEALSPSIAAKIKSGVDVSNITTSNEALSDAIKNVLDLKSANSELQTSLYDVNQEFKDLNTTLKDTSSNLAKKVVEAYKSIDEANLKSAEDALETFKTYHENIIESYQTELDALERKADLEDEIADRQQKQLDIQKAQEKLNNVLKEQNTRVYVEGQGWVWQANPKDVESAQKELQDLQTDYADWEKDTALKHQKQLLQDRIKYEQNLIKTQEDAYTAQKKIFEDQWANLDLMSEKLLAQFGGNVEKAATVLTAKLSELNSELVGMANVTLPNNLSNIASNNNSSITSVNNSSPPIPSTNGFTQVTNPVTGKTFWVETNRVKTDYKGYAYAEGGETSLTGLQWLDGKPGKPERVLSPEQTMSFNKLVDYLPKMNNIIDRIMPNIKIPSFTPAVAGAGGETFIISGNISVYPKDFDDFTRQLKQRGKLK